jgi:hypothetical protein
MPTQSPYHRALTHFAAKLLVLYWGTEIGHRTVVVMLP